jgi:hypothetical protein
MNRSVETPKSIILKLRLERKKRRSLQQPVSAMQRMNWGNRFMESTSPFIVETSLSPGR